MPSPPANQPIVAEAVAKPRPIATNSSPIASPPIAFTATLTPVAPQEVAVSQPLEVVYTARPLPAQAPEIKVNSPPQHGHPEAIGPSAPKQIMAVPVEHEEARPDPKASDPAARVSSAPVVHDETPDPQAGSRAPKPQPATDRQWEPVPPRRDHGGQRLEPRPQGREDTGPRPKDEMRTSGTRTEESRKKPELPQTGKAFSEPGAPETGPASRPTPVFSATSERGNTPAAAKVNQDPAPVKVEPKSEMNPHLPPPTREISLRVADADSAKVDVRLMERAGKVHVAVRTDDRELAKSLQSDLGELVVRLERKGYNAETWTPGERSNSSSARDMAGSRGDGSGSGWAQQQPEGQGRGDSHRRARVQWETEMGQRFEEGQGETNDDQSN